MSEGVPTDVAQAQLATGRTDVILLDRAGMVTASGHCAGENPVFLRLGTLPFPVEQNGSEIGIEREIILRILGLDRIHHAVHLRRCFRITDTHDIASSVHKPSLPKLTERLREAVSEDEEERLYRCWGKAGAAARPTMRIVFRGRSLYCFRA